MTAEFAPSRPDELRMTRTGDALALSGALVVRTLADLPRRPDARRIELAGLTALDTAGCWYLARAEAEGIALSGLGAAHRDLYDNIRKAMPVPDAPRAPVAWWRQALIDLGARVVSGWAYLRALTEYLGRFLAGLGHCVLHPRQFRLTSLVHHCQETGLKAVPIVALMAFLIGVVLAFQGAAQLRQFGAEVFVVNLIAISVLRELGILLTAIIVAGRTASALTASIGSMKMREEIDAMRTLGLDPDLVLLVPRVLALVITLPLLGLVADIAGLVGGAIMSWVELGVSPAMFRTRLIADTSVNHVIAGLVKAPVFAVIIGIIGVQAGMQVGSDAESLGRMTSNAVVSAIFAVIVADALFSIFFSQVGL